MFAKLQHFLNSLDDRQERIYLTVFVTLFLSLYSPINLIAGSWSASSAETALDRAIPFMPAWVYIYALLYVLLPLPLVLPAPRPAFRRICASFAVTSLVSFVVFVLFPVHMDLRPTDLDTTEFASWLLALIHLVDTPANCLPSLHVSLSLLAALCAWSIDRAVGRIAIPLALVVAFSTLLVKQHWVWDMLTGWALGFSVWAVFVRGKTGERLPATRRGVYFLLAGLVLLFGLARVIHALEWIPL